MRYVAVACAATAILLLSACGDGDDSSTTTSEPSTTTSEEADDGPRTLAEGDVVLVATAKHEERTLSISAVEEDGEVTGEFRMSDHVIRIECADTDTGGVVILGGTVTAGDVVPPGDLLGLIIQEGDPDRVLLVGNDEVGAQSCSKLVEWNLENFPDESYFTSVKDGYDIETGTPEPPPTGSVGVNETLDRAAPCTKGTAQAFLKNFGKASRLGDRMESTRLGDYYRLCQFRLYENGKTFRFSDQDYIVGGHAAFWTYDELEELGMSRAEAIADMKSITEEVEIATIVGGNVGTFEPVPLIVTKYRDALASPGRVVYNHRAFITKLPVGQYFVRYTERVPGEPDFTATARLVITAA